MYGNLVSSEILPRYRFNEREKEFFPTYKTPNKGFLGVLHDWDPRLEPPETTPQFLPKVKKAKSALWGFELKREKRFGGWKFFSRMTGLLFLFLFLFWGRAEAISDCCFCCCCCKLYMLLLNTCLYKVCMSATMGDLYEVQSRLQYTLKSSVLDQEVV